MIQPGECKCKLLGRKCVFFKCLQVYTKLLFRHLDNLKLQIWSGCYVLFRDRALMFSSVIKAFSDKGLLIKYFFFLCENFNKIVQSFQHAKIFEMLLKFYSSAEVNKILYPIYAKAVAKLFFIISGTIIYRTSSRIVDE